MAAIAGLLMLELVASWAFMAWALSAQPGVGGAGTRGLAWLTQAARVVALLTAARLWVRLAAADFARRAPRVLVPLGVLLLAYGDNGANVAGTILLLVAMSGMKWPSAIRGWARAGVLLAGPLLLILLTLFPYTRLAGGELVSGFVGMVPDWPPALLHGGGFPEAIRGELALARPLDHAVQTLVDLFRVQLLVLILRSLTLPVRLSGMSLKRRFLVHSIFVRQIPALLSLITLTLVVYFAAGLHRAEQLREEMARTVARAGVAGRAVLATPAAGRATALAAARDWLAPEDGGAWIVVRALPPTPDSAAGASLAGAGAVTPAAPALAALEGTPRVLAESFTPGRTDGTLEGLVAHGPALFLVNRSAGEVSGRRVGVEVFVPVDSAWLSRRAERLRTRITVRTRGDVRISERGVNFGPGGDTTSTLGHYFVASSGRTGMAPTDQVRLFLARSMLPAGDWRAGWLPGATGAIETRLELTRSLARGWLEQAGTFAISNVLMLLLVVVAVGLVGITEGMAVRSGRGIVEAIESEVGTLREAATRFGAGDLAHRVPVRGRDEFAALSAAFNDMAASLERQRAELAEKERLEEDIAVARGIQQRMLPQEPPRLPGLEVAGHSDPSREVGGDLYHWAELEGGRLAIALGDVSGKSVPAALLMSNVMSGLRSEQLRDAPIEESLGRLNQLMVEQIEPGRFVTLFHGVIEPAADRLRYTSAGHNAPLLLRADGEAKWLDAGGVPLGVMPGARYPVAEERFGPGDTLVVYSDGVSEAEGPGAAPETPALFGEERLLEVARGAYHGGAAAVVAALLEAIRSFGQGRPAADDITLVVVRRAR